MLGLLIPEFATFKLKNDYKNINRIISILFNMVSIFSICAIGVFLTFADELSYIIYKNLEVSKFIIIMCPLIVFMYLDTIIDSMLRGLDRQVEVMFCNIIDLFITISFIYLIVPKFGVYGYIFAIYVSEIFNFSVSLYQLYKETNFKLNYLFNVIIPLIVSLFIKFFFDNASFILAGIHLNTTIKVISFIVIYLFILIIISILRIHSHFKSASNSNYRFIKM